MNIAVCIKRVPDMELRFSIAGDRKSLEQGGLKYEMGDFDGYALEVGLQLAEKHGGEVLIISLGPDGVQETLRKGLAMGAARAVQLKADEVPFDGRAIAEGLAAELKGQSYDLILFGRMATDTAHGTVGPMTADILDLPCVSGISQLEIADRRGTARRDLEGASETVQFQLPAVLTIDEGIARPRLASLKGIMAAKKKPRAPELRSSDALGFSGLDPGKPTVADSPLDGGIAEVCLGLLEIRFYADALHIAGPQCPGGRRVAGAAAHAVPSARLEGHSGRW
jgi:electron transfer flavoprotein beta subunit